MSTFVPVVLPEITTTMIKAQIDPYSTRRKGMPRNISNIPSPSKMPGVAADDQMMKSRVPLPLNLVRTRMYAKIENKSGLIVPAKVPKITVFFSADLKVSLPSTAVQ